MNYTTVEKTDRMSGTMTRLNGGSLRLYGPANELVGTCPLNTPAGTVTNGVITFAGFPKNFAPALTGVNITSAAFVDAANVARTAPMTVGLAGSGAEVIVSKLSANAGDTITVLASPTIAHF